MQYYQKFKDQKLDVLIERSNEEESEGHTSNYILVKVLKKLNSNQIYSLKITNICQEDVYADANDCLISL